MRLDTDPRFTAMQVEESFTGVEELDIEVFQSMYASCDFNVLKLFEGVRGVSRAMVRGSVGDGTCHFDEFVSKAIRAGLKDRRDKGWKVALKKFLDFEVSLGEYLIAFGLIYRDRTM